MTEESMTAGCGVCATDVTGPHAAKHTHIRHPDSMKLLHGAGCDGA